MNNQEFNRLVKNQCESINKVLSAKAGEYASDTDRLHNFKSAARKLDTTPQVALNGMDMKHYVSIQDMILNGLPATLLNIKSLPEKRAACIKYIDEKIGDHINYMILLKAILMEQL
jgi:hypothetical protein